MKASAPMLAADGEKHLHQEVCPEIVRALTTEKNILNGEWPEGGPTSTKQSKITLHFTKAHFQKDPNFWKSVLFTAKRQLNSLGMLMCGEELMGAAETKWQPTVKFVGGGGGGSMRMHVSCCWNRQSALH